MVRRPLVAGAAQGAKIRCFLLAAVVATYDNHRHAIRGLRYIVEWRGLWIALAGWQASAFRSRHRNNWIGWPPELRFQRLHLIANNTRFLILGAKGVFPCLASFVPGAMLRRPSDDWQSRYGHPIPVAETFVNPASFEGTVYPAR